MAQVILVEASAREPGSGAPVAVRLAGGGARHYTHKGCVDWLGGVAAAPLVTSLLGFDGGFTGGAIPTTTAIGFMPADATVAARIARLAWTGAEVSISSADDTGPPVAVERSWEDAGRWRDRDPWSDSAVGAEPDEPDWRVDLAGTVAGYAYTGGSFAFTVSDLAGGLARPIAGASFAGTGGIEGLPEAAGRIKRRSWGRCWNVEGRLLDKANNLWEFGDPTRALLAFDAIKDKGRAGPLTLVAWAGSVAATLAALIATGAPNGGAAVAPSIACVKWWTTPAGPLTADLRGEVAGGYVESVAGIAARITAACDGPPLANLPGLAALRPDAAGIHIDSPTETGAQALDRLLLRASLAWGVAPAGELEVTPIAFADPIETLVAASIDREAAWGPVTEIAVGYERNHRRHTDAEISAAILASDVLFEGDTSLEDAIRDAGETAEWDKVGDPTGTKPADNATNSADSSSPLGPNGTVGDALDDLADLAAARAALDEAVEELRDGAVATDASLQALARAGVDRDAAQRQLGRGADRLAESALRLTLEAGRQQAVIADAGIVVDPATGRARLWAVHDALTRVGSAEVSLDAQGAAIRSKASYTDMELAIANAQLSGGNVNLTGLYARVSDAELELDALEGAVALRATTAELDALGLTVTDVGERLDSLGDVRGVTTEVRQVRRLADDGALAALRGIVAGDVASRAGQLAIAEARRELTTRMDDLGAIEAAARLKLAVALVGVEARLIEEARVRISEAGVLAEAIRALGVIDGDQAAAIARLDTASIAAERGIAATRTTIRQQARGADQSAEALLASLIAGDQADRRGRAQMVQVQAEMTTELVEGRRSAAADRTALSARIGAAEAEAGRMLDVLTEADLAQARSIELLEGSLDDQAASVSSLREVVVGPNGATARALVELDVNGRVSGLTQTNDGTSAAFGVTADVFGVYHPITGALLFYVDADGAVVGKLKAKSIETEQLANGSALRTVVWITPADVVIASS